MIPFYLFKSIEILILFLSNVSFIHKRFVTFSYHFVIILFVNFVSIRTVNGKSTQPRVIEGTLVEGQAAAGAGAGAGGGAGGPQPIVVQVPPAGGGGSGQQFSSAGASAGASSGGAHVTGGQNGEPLTIHLPAGLGQGGAGGAPGQPIVIPLPGPGGAGGNDFDVFINNFRKMLCFKNVLLKDLKLSDLYRSGIQISQIDDAKK